MGIASSNDAGIKKARSCILGDEWGYWMEDAVGELALKELLKRVTVTESETGEDEHTSEGPCKEILMAHRDCTDKHGYDHGGKCKVQAIKLYNCMCSHPDYYQPAVATFKAVEEYARKEGEAYFLRKQAFREDALAAREQALRDEFRKFR